MEEINLIICQEKLEENRRNQLLKDRNQLLKDATKENYKKQEATNTLLKNIIMIVLMLMIVVWGLKVNQAMKTRAYNNCIANGYEESYCLKNS